jgi:hypothetical protein
MLEAPFRAFVLRIEAGHVPSPARWTTIGAAMQKKVFWLSFTALGLIGDLLLPFKWALAATLPILALSWWIAYRSDWF